MLNQQFHLNTKMFDADVEQIPIRTGFGHGLLEAGEKDKNIVALCADLTESTQMHLFRDAFPDRFIQIGIAEQNLASVAAGMAHMGKTAFLSSYAMFSPGRNWEQIRTTICYNDVPVKILGSHAGVSVGPDGGTHQAIEDIAITRVLPNMVVISPCDAVQAKKAALATAQTKEPTYIRLAREKSPIMTTEETPFEIGKAQLVYIPEVGLADVGIIATGALLHKALTAAKNLEAKGIKVKVLNMATIKPMDTDAVLAIAKETKALVTVEEHQIGGGMGSMVAEYLAQYAPTPIEFIGVHDEFGQSGTPAELIEFYKMGSSHIETAVEKILKRK